jgi:hypothetical protein
MKGDAERVEHAKWLFERTLGWIAAADAKVGVTMALDTAMLGGLATAFAASDAAARTAWCYLTLLLACGAMAIAVFCAGMAAVPRMLGPVSSLIFFSRISEMAGVDYSTAFRNMTESAFLDDLTTQIHRNSEIAAEKHAWVRRSLLWSFFGAIPWIAAVAMLVKL